MNTDREGFLKIHPALHLSAVVAICRPQRSLVSGASFSYRGYSRIPIIIDRSFKEKELELTISRNLSLTPPEED